MSVKIPTLAHFINRSLYDFNLGGKWLRLQRKRILSIDLFTMLTLEVNRWGYKFKTPALLFALLLFKRNAQYIKI